MKVIKVLLLAFIVFSTAYLVGSVTRNITDSMDNKETLIRNSKGNYWEPTGANLQAAIEDLGEDGFVWVGSDISLDSPVLLEGKNHLHVDFQGHTVTLNDDVPFVIFRANATNDMPTTFCGVKNARVILTETHTSSVILLTIPGTGGWPRRVRYNTIENIEIVNPGSSHDYTGIHLQNFGTSNFLYNTFNNIKMNTTGIGIHLQHDQYNSGWGNGNYFENIFIDGFETMIWYNVTRGTPKVAEAFNQNVFNNVQGIAKDYSVDGVKDICHNGNHFDHVYVLDWDETGPHTGNQWSLNSQAGYTYICANNITDIVDNGVQTEIACGV